MNEGSNTEHRGSLTGLVVYLLTLCLSRTNSYDYKNWQTTLTTSIRLISYRKPRAQAGKNHAQHGGADKRRLFFFLFHCKCKSCCCSLSSSLFMHNRGCFQMMSLSIPANFVHVAAKSHLTDVLSLVWISQVNEEQCVREKYRV